VHIDIFEGSSNEAADPINTHMIRCGSFDPRRHHDFPYTLAEARVGKLKKLRILAGGMSNHCRELWKVHKNFSLREFERKVAGLPKPPPTTTRKKQPSTPDSPKEQKPPARPRVRIVCIFNGNHTVNVYESLQFTRE